MVIFPDHLNGGCLSFQSGFCCKVALCLDAPRIVFFCFGLVAWAGLPAGRT